MSHTIVRARKRSGTPPSLRAVSQVIVNGTSTSSITIPVPSGAVTGDLLVAFINWRRGSSAPTLTTPSGWTQILLQTQSNQVFAAFWKIRASETSQAFTVTGTSATSGALGHMAAFSGHKASAPISGFSAMTPGSAQTATIPIPAVSSAPNCGYYACAQVQSDDSSRRMTWPTMTELTDLVTASSSTRSIGASTAWGSSSDAGYPEEVVTLSSAQTFRFGANIAIAPA